MLLVKGGKGYEKRTPRKSGNGKREVSRGRGEESKSCVFEKTKIYSKFTVLKMNEWLLGANL